MKTTITDVAKEAGVSMKTVSRVLNNEPNVAKATRERVRDVARRLQYSPNLAARGLASSRSYLIALVYDNASPSYIYHIQAGATEACRKHGYHLVLEPISLERGEVEDAERILGRIGVDGVILTPPLSDSEEMREMLRRVNIPHVLVAPEEPGTSPAVRMDDTEAARQMTEYLLGQGHTDIGFILGHPDHGATELRRLGFETALKAHGHPLRDDRILPGDFSFRSGVEAAVRLLSDPRNRPTAIFASNDDMAAGVVSVAGRMNVAVPEELAVCGFDDTPLAQILWPKLTTVAQPIHEMGRKAAEILVDRHKSDPLLQHTLDFELVIRESTRLT
jgi:LacI family transcriptional regulator